MTTRRIGLDARRRRPPLSPTRSSLVCRASSLLGTLLLQLLARRGPLRLALPVRIALGALEDLEAVAVLLLLAAPAPALRLRLEGHVAHGHGQQQQREHADADDDGAGCLHADTHRAVVDGASGAQAFVLEVEGVVGGYGVAGHGGWFCGKGSRCLLGGGKGKLGACVCVGSCSCGLGI